MVAFDGFGGWLGMSGRSSVAAFRVSAATLCLLGAILMGGLMGGCASSSRSEGGGDMPSFRNIAPQALGKKAFVINRYPGVAIFDYDRDGDQDFYVTQMEGGPNFLFRNEGGGAFSEVSREAGVAAEGSNSTGVVACDIDNDGYQDLYVGSRGRHFDALDFRSADMREGLREAITDRLFLNDGNGAFSDITAAAFGDSANSRSAASAACADVDGDGWLDIYVGNRADFDFVRFDRPNHHGNFNVLYVNNGNLTFTEMARRAGVDGPQIVMRAPDGRAIFYEDRSSGELFQGYDPEMRDFGGNRVGDPTGQTWATLFFDHDGDGDSDLWIADDGDRLKVFRNDSARGDVRFSLVEAELPIGQWMGFALGDYDSDEDLDVFVTNIGFHPLTRRPVPVPSADCAYTHQFAWGSCFHLLMRNDGSAEQSEAGGAFHFVDVAQATHVEPSRIMPPVSLNAENIHPAWEAPAGVAAYDFGFGAVFLDYENDGDQDLYWLGSLVSRGEGPGGQLYPGAGRMLRGDGLGGFEDVTVEAHLLDTQDVDYSTLDPDDPSFDAERQRISPAFHENGKGLAKGDLNGDGFVDLIATNSSGDVYKNGSVGFAKGPLFVWINEGSDRRWITLRLKGRMAIDGTGSNADAVGARVYLKARTSADRALTQVQEVLASSTFLSMNSLDVHFGLGEAENVDEIAIVWPSGAIQTLNDVAANQILVVEEPKAQP